MTVLVWARKYWAWLVTAIAGLTLIVWSRVSGKSVSDLLRKTRELSDARAGGIDAARRTEVEQVLEAEHGHENSVATAKTKHDQTTQQLEAQAQAAIGDAHDRTAKELAERLAASAGVRLGK